VLENSLTEGPNRQYKQFDQLSNFPKGEFQVSPSMPESAALPLVIGSLQSAVRDRIRQMILAGTLAPGTRLRQNELANMFGVSAMPVREALRELQAQGLVVLIPRRGAIVASLSAREYEEIFRMREELEVLAVRWAVDHHEAVALSRLKSILDRVEKAEADRDAAERERLVREFHFTIYETSDRQHLIRTLARLWDLSHPYRRIFSTIQEAIPLRLEHLKNLYRAWEAQDPDALETSLRELYAFVRRTLTPYLTDGSDR